MSETARRARGWNVVEEPAQPVAAPTPDPAPSPAQQEQHAVAMRMVMLGIATLSQRFVVGLAALWTTTFTAALVASAFALWWRVVPEPTALQLLGLAGYAAFVLLIEIVRRRR